MNREVWTKPERDLMVELCRYHAQTLLASRNGFDIDDLFLQSLDCSLGQGFLFEKAVPAEQVTWLLESKWSDHQVDPVEEGLEPKRGLQDVG